VRHRLVAQALNRTMLELKLARKLAEDLSIEALNRTMLELK